MCVSRQDRQKQLFFVAKGRVQTATVESSRLDHVLNRGGFIAAFPEHDHGTVEDFVLIKLFHARHLVMIHVGTYCYYVKKPVRCKVVYENRNFLPIQEHSAMSLTHRSRISTVMAFSLPELVTCGKIPQREKESTGMDAQTKATILHDVIRRRSATGGGDITTADWLAFVEAQNDGYRTGPAIGEPVPDFTLPDQRANPGPSKN